MATDKKGSTEVAFGQAVRVSTGSAFTLALVRPGIDLELQGADGAPVPDAAYRVTLADGSVREGRLSGGRARVDGVPAGPCRVSFPEYDAASWEVLAQEREGAAAPSEVVATGEAARSGGETPSSGAAPVKGKPDVELDAASEQQTTLPTGRRYRVRLGPPAIELELFDERGEPVADAEYRVTLPDGSTREGRLEDGRARVADLPRGLLRVTFPGFDAASWAIAR